MYVYPTRQGVGLPAGWPQIAPLPPAPPSLAGGKVQAGREKWIGQWRTIIEG
jgi:thiamine transport system substrate-binding protein